MVEIKVMRNENQSVNIWTDAEGRINDLMDELAAGVAQAVIRMADDLGAEDSVHEAMGRVVSSLMMEYIARELMQRDAATDKLPEA